MEEDSSGGGIWVFIAIVVIGWVIYDAVKEYKYGPKAPFWKGTDLIQVCKVPYYSSSECYRLRVTLVDAKTARINFNNGGYVYTSDMECYFTTSYPGGTESHYVYCRSWDDEDQQWDFAPLNSYF